MTTIDPHTAPIDTIRDWLATEQWPAGGQRTDENGIRYWKRCVNEDWSPAHPYPPTIDGAASAMPEGWEWRRLSTFWNGGYGLWWEAFIWKESVTIVRLRDTGDEIADRYRLAAACIIATKESA